MQLSLTGKLAELSANPLNSPQRSMKYQPLSMNSTTGTSSHLTKSGSKPRSPSTPQPPNAQQEGLKPLRLNVMRSGTRRITSTPRERRSLKVILNEPRSPITRLVATQRMCCKIFTRRTTQRRKCWSGMPKPQSLPKTHLQLSRLSTRSLMETLILT